MEIRAAIAKGRRPVAPTDPEAEWSKVKMLADLGSGKDPLASVQVAAFVLCPHMAEGKLWSLPLL